VFQDLRDQERVEGRLIIPNFRIEVMSIETKGRFAQFEALIGAYLDGCAKGYEALGNNLRGEKQSKRNKRLRLPVTDNRAPDVSVTVGDWPLLCLRRACRAAHFAAESSAHCCETASRRSREPGRHQCACAI
jgi:hypothetical protein